MSCGYEIQKQIPHGYQGSSYDRMRQFSKMNWFSYITMILKFLINQICVKSPVLYIFFHQKSWCLEVVKKRPEQEFFESDFLGFFALPKSWYWRFSNSDILYPESMVITKIKYLSHTVQDLILRQVTLVYLLGFSVGYLVFYSWVWGIWSCMDLAATFFFPCLIFSSYPSPLPNVTKH